MSKTYQVLWIDDEYEKLSQFVGDAADNDIKLVGFTSVDAGFAHLKLDLSRYDAILLDAKSFEKKDQVTGTEHERALDLARDEINALKHQKYFPYFVLTGQKGLQDDLSFTHRYEGRYFKKGSPDETERLFVAIKKEADEQPDTQLRHRYAPAFAACTDQILGDNARPLLTKVLRGVEAPQSAHGDDDLLNNLRKLVEAFLYAAHRHGLLPDQCLKSNREMNLNSSCIFLKGWKVNPPQGGESVKARKPPLPVVLSDALSALVELTSNGSHYQQDHQITPEERAVAKKKLLELRQGVQTPYLFASLTFRLLDLLVWLCNLLSDALAFEQLKNAWDPIPNGAAAPTAPVTPINGVVRIITAKGDGFFRSNDGLSQGFIPKALVEEKQLAPTMSVQVILGPDLGNGKQPIVQRIL